MVLFDAPPPVEIHADPVQIKSSLEFEFTQRLPFVGFVGAVAAYAVDGISCQIDPV